MDRKPELPSPQKFPPLISQLTRSSRRATILLAAVKRGIFEALAESESSGTGGGVAAGRVAETLRLDGRATEIVLNALAGMKFVRKRGERFRNTPFSRRYLVSSSPRNILGILLHFGNLAKAWADLDEVLVSGKPYWDTAPHRGRRERSAAVFARAMYDIGRGVAKKLTAQIDLSGCKSLIDIGGSNGVFSYFFCRRYGGLKAVVFDLPGIIVETKKYLRQYAMGRRIRAVAGDYTTDELPGRHDAALVSHVLHGEGEDGCRQLFASVYGCLNPGGLIIVRDFLLDKSRTSPGGAAVFAVNMLINTTAGRSYTRGEVTRWLKEAGFQKVHLLGPSDENGALVLTARKP